MLDSQTHRAGSATTVAFFFVAAVLPIVAVWYFCDVSLRPLVDALSAAGRAR